MPTQHLLGLFQSARRYCPHHVGHYLGMDVHDTPDVSRSQPLQPGMVITIEPGKPLTYPPNLLQYTSVAVLIKNFSVAELHLLLICQ